MKKAIFLVTLVFLLAAGCKQETAVNAPGTSEVESAKTAVEPYKVGALLAVSGPASSLGVPEENTLRMMAEKINAEGGINGHPLEIVYYDTEGDETKAVTLAKRLISADRVKAIIGPTQTGTSLAILDIVAESEILMISLALSHQIVVDEEGKARPWVFKTPASDSMSVEKIYEFLKKREIDRIGIMTVANGYGDSGRAELKRLAPEWGIEVVADERFGQSDVDMTPQLVKINQAGAQAIIVWAVQKAPAIIAKNYQSLGLKQVLVQSQGVATKSFIELCGEAADGQYLPAGKLIVAEHLADDDPQKQILLAYKREYEQKYGPVSVFGAHAWDAIKLLEFAMQKAGTDNPSQVKAALEGIRGFVGIDGIFNPSPDDHVGLTKDAFVMVKIENQDWKLVEE